MHYNKRVTDKPQIHYLNQLLSQSTRIPLALVWIPRLGTPGLVTPGQGIQGLCAPGLDTPSLSTPSGYPQYGSL